jgi:acetylornithine/LysW-gamma-L-lysine aminotransferase
MDSKDSGEIISQEQDYGPLVYGSKDFVITHGKGAILYTKDGRELLDFVAGHGVGNIGHAHPKVVKAIQDQASNITVLHSAFPNEQRSILFKKLAEITPGKLSNTFLSNSGSEAVEAAIKIAIVNHRNIKEPHFIAMKRSFHGRTLGALALTFGQTYRKSFESSMGLRCTFANFGDIESIKSAITENTVGIITEVVQGEGGIYPAPLDFPKSLRELCDEKGLTLIFDEIQSGMGRTGKMFACEHYNTVPDVLCIAKSLAGGVPIGATVSRKDLFEPFEKGEMGSTFGGNPLACAAANATIDAILEEKMLENATAMGKLIETTVEGWFSEPSVQNSIKEQRGLGLMRGIQLKDKVGAYIVNCQQQGLLLIPAGMTVLRLLPPLVTTELQIEQALGILKNVLAR